MEIAALLEMKRGKKEAYLRDGENSRGKKKPRSPTARLSLGSLPPFPPRLPPLRDPPGQIKEGGGYPSQ